MKPEYVILLAEALEPFRATSGDLDGTFVYLVEDGHNQYHLAAAEEFAAAILASPAWQRLVESIREELNEERRARNLGAASVDFWLSAHEEEARP